MISVHFHCSGELLLKTKVHKVPEIGDHVRFENTGKTYIVSARVHRLVSDGDEMRQNPIRIDLHEIAEASPSSKGKGKSE